MSIIFIMIIVSALGLAIVGWIILRDGSSGGVNIEKLEPDQVKEFATDNVSPKKSTKPAFSFMSRPSNKTAPRLSDIPKDIKRKEKPPKDKSASFNLFSQLTKARLERPPKNASVTKLEQQGTSELKDFISSEEKKINDLPYQPKTMPSSSQQSTSGTASLTTHEGTPHESSMISKDEQKNIDQEIELSLQVNELKEKNDKLEILIKEKNDELEKAQKALNNEIKNSKEFNKVKDLLEKEIKENKDKNRDVKSELASLQLERDNFKKRTTQLEEKLKYLDKEVLAKDNENVELLSRIKTLQAAAKPSQQSIPQPEAVPEAVKEQVPPDPSPQTIASETSKLSETTPSTQNKVSDQVQQVSQPPEQQIEVKSEVKPETESEPKNIPSEPRVENINIAVSDKQEASNTDTENPDKAQDGGGFLKLPPDPTSTENRESTLPLSRPETPKENIPNSDKEAPKSEA